MQIRAATEADREVVASLFASQWRQTFSLLPEVDGVGESDLLAAGGLFVDDDLCLLAEEEGGVVGFVSGSRLSGELIQLSCSERDGEGVAEMLLAAALQRIAQPELPAWLWLWEGDERALSFYQRHGFLDSGWRRQSFQGAQQLTFLRLLRDSELLANQVNE